MAQFFVCGTVFVLLVAVKLLLPAKIEWLSGRIDSALERNMDVTAVFSAVGRAFAGQDGGGLDDLYQSVFHPDEASAIPTGATAGDAMSQGIRAAAPGTLNSGDGWLTAPPMNAAPRADSSPDPSAAPPPKDGTEKPTETHTATQRLSYILYADKTLPDNVSMEQLVLGFDYCTPVMGVLSSNFGYREHPIEGEEKFHYGLDLAADEGAEIHCFADGTVTAVGESSSYGKYVIVAHDSGFSTLYAHCSKITIPSGAAVKRGQKVAEVGHTGEATGAHLHFEIHAADTYLNPIYYVSPM